MLHALSLHDLLINVKCCLSVGMKPGESHVL